MTASTIALAELAEKGADIDVLRQMVQFMAQRLMEIDVEGRCGAPYHEKSAERLNSRNGSRERTWEMGADARHCVLTLVERVTGYLVMKKLKARNKEQASAALARAIIGLGGRVRTITLDNGTEFHDYENVEKQLGVKFYFATPYHSWERGTNENTNGLVRQYLPKGECMKALTQARCNRIAKELNDRPRERLGFKTPAEIFRPC
ncbi:MAG: IS30 family transposase [Burkholderiaceae bacterium]|nr:IS30 family transposase [Burkholderiaceae bacterium]